MEKNMTERERQAGNPVATRWVVSPSKDFKGMVDAVVCYAATAKGALRVAEAVSPGVTWSWPISATEYVKEYVNRIIDSTKDRAAAADEMERYAANCCSEDSDFYSEAADEIRKRA